MTTTATTLKTALAKIAASSSNAALRDKAQQAAKKLGESDARH